MIASASVVRFDGLFRSSERSIHIAGIRKPFTAGSFFMRKPEQGAGTWIA
jgi:hypothetical protein